MRQPESALVVEPFVRYIKDSGWNHYNIHGSQFQQGLPDGYITHPKYSPRWVEFKVIRNGTFSFTPAQKRKFPLLMAHGVPIYLIAGTDMRGISGLAEIQREYRKLFEEPNCWKYIGGRMRI